MRKIFLSFIIFGLVVNICQAECFELSDVIKEAREAQMQQRTEERNKDISNSQTNFQNKEQTASDKINTKEVLSQNQDFPNKISQ